MILTRARVRDYWSIHDSGWFDIEDGKTILVGPNEAGKTALLHALEAINPPPGLGQFDWLRDYPRSRLNDIQTGKIDPADVTVTEAEFKLEPDEQEQISKIHPELKNATGLLIGRRLDNTKWHRLIGGPKIKQYSRIKKDLSYLQAHATKTDQNDLLNDLQSFTSSWSDTTRLTTKRSGRMVEWLNRIVPSIDESSPLIDRVNRIKSKTEIGSLRDLALSELEPYVPVFVYFSSYFKVRPSIHLRHLANRIDSGILEDESYDFGNKCLLQLLGFSARELADLGDAVEPQQNQPEALKTYKDQLDRRHYSLNAAQVLLTDLIQDVWIGEAEEEKLRLRLHADRQYLKVVVEDALGVEVELDQRSAGFQWLVSFFIVFRSQSEDEYQNAILLLDEPGLSLHALKQRQFRHTVSKIAETNQTLYTTHSPFMVGPSELPIVRVVEMIDRKVGTKVHLHVVADDPRSIFPLQEALGYDLAQSLFAQERNLVCEGLTDYWYLDGIATQFRDAGLIDMNEKIALVPAGNASKVVYYATILHSQRLKVAALLDSDQEGENAATQDEFVGLLGDKKILRTKDVYNGSVSHPEIEDLLRDTLVKIAFNDIGWDVTSIASSQPNRPIVDIFIEKIGGFSKYKLAKTFLRWIAVHDVDELTSNEKDSWVKLIKKINKALN